VVVVITSIGFLDVSTFTAMYLVKHKDRAVDGFLPLRAKDDLPILREWKSARALLTRIRNQAAVLRGSAVEFGPVGVETLAPQSGLPWRIEDEDHTALYARLRVALVTAPNSWVFSGMSNAHLPVGVVHLVENRTLCSQLNLSDTPTVHLVIDIKRPDVES
jgi:hypothetical protein